MSMEFISQNYDISIKDVRLNVAAIHRSGTLEPVVFLHGFGSTKEDYADIVRYTEFNDHPYLAYDAPGCGETECDSLSAISIPFLVETALTMIAKLGFERFHLVGHSMGGLTALMLAHAHPERVLSFVNIEGNIAPEDCFLSRQVINYPAEDEVCFFDDFISRTRHSPAWASALYSASLRHKVRAGAVRHIFKSMVDYSDHAELMSKFLNLPFPKMFMYGEQNASLSYLDHIRSRGVTLAEIPHCGHFPMYSNPVEMWYQISKHQQTAAALSR
ncbi:alpha/beta fold hydrolase (plasmid) [Klebsiella pneumoniae]|uniref:alpha/beta fold hydrolase n=1 Tax=Klebsiella pneumoniae complex TaxID=3390273 RepID=UPI00190F68EC|nr:MULTISPECIES: alpha/beta hydrolase [Klebsiella]MDG0316319.1 alpha/beta hydrolase [Klebsiella pneumoniae]GKN26981.1 alpha/beta hydrolase [Klebsiella variicola]HCI8568243.1 alpha/beta hydrolase [Klebsiella variicola]